MNFTSMSIEQFHTRFDSEEACFEIVAANKWPNGFNCPRCSHRHAYVTCTRRLPLYECSSCRHQTSLIAGTIMEGSRTTLRKWLLAIFLVSRTEQGTTAVEIQEKLQVTYKTAWSMLHKIRQKLQLANHQSSLSGNVQINSAVYGRPFNPSVHKHPQEHLLLVGASQDENGEIHNLKIKHTLPNHPKERHIARSHINDFCENYVQTPKERMHIVTGLYSPKKRRPLMSLAAQASKWINQTFHGIGSKYLQLYLDEFCFRFNYGKQKQSFFNDLSLLCFFVDKRYSEQFSGKKMTALAA